MFGLSAFRYSRLASSTLGEVTRQAGCFNYSETFPKCVASTHEPTMRCWLGRTFGSSAVSLAILGCLLLTISGPRLQADSEGTLSGRVVDPSGRAVPNANVVLRNSATLVEQMGTTNNEGIYEVAGLPVGTYRMQIMVPGFRLYTVEALTVDVARAVVHNVDLEVGEISDEVIVESQAPLLDASSTSVGHVMDGQTVQEIPLNGRYFLDLAVLAPGSVTSSQNGFNSKPYRGLGAFSINTAGSRDDSVNYMINGVTLNDQFYNGITFQPSISSIQEFRIDNSTLSAEYGHSAGGVVIMATRSGTNDFHGELFEFLRNDALDARNFFTFTSRHPPPFKRNQFGADGGGPIIKSKTFFYFSYEGLRLNQKLQLNSVVLSDAQRGAATDPTVAGLIGFIPRENFVDSSGTPRFQGSAPAPVNGDQWGLDFEHGLSQTDRLHGYYSIYRTKTVQPDGGGATVPGFGFVQPAQRQFFSLNETHTFSNHVNALRFGFDRELASTQPSTGLNPAAFGINDGITQPVGLPQISIAGGALSLGGPSSAPSFRANTTIVAADTLSILRGRNFLKIGGEFRQFLNNNYRLGTGLITFPSVAAFLADNASSFSVTLGNQSSSIALGALGFFIEDQFRWNRKLSFDVGLRYDWNMTPTERFGRFTVFDPSTASLVRLGHDQDIYHQNNKNLQPHFGFAWTPGNNEKTVVRSAYALIVNEPITNVVVGAAGNPPLANPLTYTGSFALANAINLAKAAGLAPASVAHGFDNSYVQTWNLNLQRELSPTLAVMAGYVGSKGTHLTLVRNINQPINGVRPFPVISSSSRILPGTPVGNIIQTESTGNSSYNALWISATKRLSHGFTIDASYTRSKSLDYNSLSSSAVVVQDSYHLRGDKGLSDYNVPQRFAASAIYALPFHGNPLTDGWQVAAIVQVQGGNPVNIVTTSTITGVTGTVRPNVTGPITILGHPDRWFDVSVFNPAAGFGDLGRNVIIGPGFDNTDFSLMKKMKLGEKIRAEFRAEVFDLLNHSNFGQPGNVAGSPTFGVIMNTRFPTGELGSSRQVQLGIKLMF
jgi:hypothetical protein